MADEPKPLRHLSLFTGAGGGEVAAKLLGWHTLGYVEFNDYCQQVLQARVNDGLYNKAPIFTDVREFLQSGCAKQYRGFIDVVSAGFPCQPFSNAGKRQSENDTRNMWPQTIDVIRQVRPKIAYLENVPGLLSAGEKLALMAYTKIRQSDLFNPNNNQQISARFKRYYLSVKGPTYFGRILGQLAEAGYDAEWLVLSAKQVGAPHLRNRIVVMAYTPGQPTWRLPQRAQPTHTHTGQPGEHVAHTNSQPHGQQHHHAQAGTNHHEPDNELANAQGQRCSEAGQGKQRPSQRATGRSTKLSHADRTRRKKQHTACQPGQPGQHTGAFDSRINDGRTRDVANANGDQQQRRGIDDQVGRQRCQKKTEENDNTAGTQWSVEPSVGRVANGVAHRFDRLTAIGNGQVPHQMVAAWYVLYQRAFGTAYR